MDANKVLEVLRKSEWAHQETYDWCPCCQANFEHHADCELAALITELEHEAQAEAGGWKPGTEPPSTIRKVIVLLDMYGTANMRLDHYSGGWQETDPFFKIIAWHELPPLPEEKP